MYKNTEGLRKAMLSAWLDNLNEEERVKLIRKAFRSANGIEAGYISFDIRDGKIKVWSEQPSTYQPGWDEYQIILFTVEPNWVANSSWTYEEMLGEAPNGVDVEEWADKKAQEQGYDCFNDLLCDIFAENTYQDNVIFKEIKEFTEYELRPYLELLEDKE